MLEADYTLKKFDLIVANPPYFIDSLRSPDNARSCQKWHNHFIWLMQAQKWLSEEGKITFILPNDAAGKITRTAKQAVFLPRDLQNYY